jgi:hypothetical protein
MQRRLTPVYIRFLRALVEHDGSGRALKLLYTHRKPLSARRFALGRWAMNHLKSAAHAIRVARGPWCRAR